MSKELLVNSIFVSRTGSLRCISQQVTLLPEIKRKYSKLFISYFVVAVLMKPTTLKIVKQPMIFLGCLATDTPNNPKNLFIWPWRVMAWTSPVFLSVAEPVGCSTCILEWIKGPNLLKTDRALRKRVKRLEEIEKGYRIEKMRNARLIVLSVLSASGTPLREEKQRINLLGYVMGIINWIDYRLLHESRSQSHV